MADVMSTMENILATSDYLNIDLASLNLDSINLPPDEDFGIISDEDEDLVTDDFQIDQLGFGNIIVIGNLPLVPIGDKFATLERRIRAIYNLIEGVGVIRELWMPVHEQKTVGRCFIEFGTQQEAELAKDTTNGLKLGSYELVVYLFDDFHPGESLRSWMVDEKARDQFVIRSGLETMIFWNDARSKDAELVFEKTNWTEGFVQWSPLGSYLATVHSKGVAIWGGAYFKRLMRFKHPGVRYIDFSPGEKFLVTYSECDNRVVIKFFEVKTGRMKREFEISANECVSWPVFTWGGGLDDEYFARVGKDVVQVYETETFYLIDKKSMKVENVADISWSPKDAIFAMFVREEKEPARLSLVQIPGKNEYRQKALFNVTDCKMYWQSNGEYLAVKFDRYTKTKKNTYTTFEIFRMKEKDIHIEVLELENKNDKVTAFAWEPKGHRFAIIHQGENSLPDVSFYTMRSSCVTKLKTLKGKKVNALFWSPAGRFIVLAGLEGLKNNLEFHDINDFGLMEIAQHVKATNVEWDPSGRYVVTAVTSIDAIDAEYYVWSFYGKFLYSKQKDELFQFLWRPRPPSVLSREKEEEIEKNLMEYSVKYEADDRDFYLLLQEREYERKMTIEEEWEMWVSEWDRLHEEEMLERQALIGDDDSSEEMEFVVVPVEIEEFLDKTVEVICFYNE